MTRLPCSPASPVSRFDDGTWLVRGFQEARDVLAANNEAFRTPHEHEFVQGFSRSFVLATDACTSDDRSRFRTALAAAISPRRTAGLATAVMAPLARHLAGQVAAQRVCNALGNYVRPYARQVSYSLSGVPQEVAAEMGARLRAASDVINENPADAAVGGLLADVWERIRRMTERGELANHGIAGNALKRQFITADEAPLLTIPVLDMAVLDMSGALTVAAIEAVSDLPTDAQRDSADAQHCRAAVWEAARRRDDIYITRVATRRALAGEAWAQSGDRLLIDVLTANSDERVYLEPATFIPRSGQRACRFWPWRSRLHGQGARARDCCRGLARVTVVRSSHFRGRERHLNAAHPAVFEPQSDTI